ncbi:MAG: nicotinate-nucleotide adenylyltransferase [Firmicutes bacterium]|nr:nicotinate-nucleotide adenylyltransferase [Bacillota bacterium]
MLQLSDYSNYKCIAIMGGTFNPIHNGHLVAAEWVRENIGADRVIFIPTGNPPHKKNDPAYNEHRYIMTVLATAENPNFEVSRMEIDNRDISYTVETLEKIKKHLNKDCSLYFITGADAVAEILTWKDPKRLLGMCKFVAVTRPGYNKKNMEEKISDLEEHYKGNIKLVEIPSLSISSTDIRNRVTSGLTVKYLLPRSVEEYIYKFSLYVDKKSKTLESINRQLYKVLTPGRFKHTQGVAQEATRLAVRYGEDKDKAYIAGLLHDCAKCYSHSEQIKMCEDYSIKLDEYMLEQPALIHSFLGERLAKDVYSVSDSQILSAIKYHTTGKADMTLFEKIIYIADCIEPFRSDYEGLKEIRALAYKDIDQAMICALENTIDFNRKKGGIIHPLSLEALEYFKRKVKNYE